MIRRTPRVPMRIDPRESDLVSDILRYLALRGYFAWQTHDARHRPVVPGIPDIMAVSPQGDLLAVECKGEDGVVSDDQEAFMRELRDRNARVVVARCLEDVVEVVG